MLLYNGDCLELMFYLKNNQIDMVLADLPYGKTKIKWDKTINLHVMWWHFDRILKDNTPIVLFATQPFATDLINSNRENFRYEWIWSKNFSGGFSTAKKRPMQYHENILVFYKKQPKYNPQFERYAESVYKRFKEGERVNTDKQQKKSTNQIHNGFGSSDHYISFKRGKYPSSLQYFKGVPNANGVRLHPTQKPVELLEYLIRTYTDEGETVLDITMGSGSTGEACHNINRNFIGIEKDLEYFNIAKNRLERLNNV